MTTSKTSVGSPAADKGTQKIPSLHLKTKRGYLFTKSAQKKSIGRQPSLFYEDEIKTQSQPSPYFLQEKEAITTFLEKELFAAQAPDKNKGTLEIEYSIQTNADCDTVWKTVAASSLFIAPVLGFPANRACGDLYMTAVVKDVSGNKIKSYAVEKTQTMPLGLWYDRWSITPYDNPLQETLVKDAVTDIVRKISGDARTLTTSLNKAYQKKYPKKARAKTRSKPTVNDAFY